MIAKPSDFDLRHIVYWPAQCDPTRARASELHETVDRLQQSGATAIQINYEPHFRWDAHARFDALYAGLARVVEVGHAAGLPVIEHHSSTCITSRGALGQSYRGVAFDDLVCRDIRTGAKGTFRISHDHTPSDCAWCCLNNPAWQELHADHIRRYLLPAGFDGLQHDDIQFAPGWYYCGCEHCRAKFRNLFGADLPRGDHAGWENFDDPLWRDWLLFRKQSAGDEMARCREVLGADKLLFSCCSVAATSLIGQHDAGYSYEDFLRGANVIYREMIAHPRHRAVKQKHYAANWRILATDFKYYEGLTHASGRPAIQYAYLENRADLELIWRLARVHGHGSLWQTRAADYGLDKLAAFDCRHGEALFARSQPFGVALLYSDRTAALAGDDSQCALDDFRGWCEVLLESGLPFHVVPVDLLDGRALALLRDAPLVIAPNLSCLHTRVNDALREYVAGGGRLIATHATSARDERGRPHRHLALADVFGVDAVKTTRQYGLPLFVEETFGLQVAGWLDRKLPHVLGRPNDPAHSQILGWVERYNSCAVTPPAPALLRHEFGKGACLYISCPLGNAAAETGIRARQGGGFDGNLIAQSVVDEADWIDDRDPRAIELMRAAIHQMARGAWPIQVTRCPAGWYASIARQPGAFVVHFVRVNPNVSSAPQPIEIKLCGNSVTTATMFSTDGHGPRQPTIERHAERVVISTAVESALGLVSVRVA